LDASNSKPKRFDMKVRLKPAAAKRYRDLTAGNTYSVIGIEADDYRIMNDHGRPYLYPHQLFTIVDKTPGALWRETTGDDGERYVYPPQLSEPGFFEDYFNSLPAAIATLQAYLLKAAARSRNHKKRLGDTRAA
jgi:hypothetical protein